MHYERNDSVKLFTIEEILHSLTGTADQLYEDGLRMRSLRVYKALDMMEMMYKRLDELAASDPVCAHIVETLRDGIE